MIAYRATLDVSKELVQVVAKLLAAERRRRGTPRGSRAMSCFWQAVLGLRWLRDRTPPDALARDHGISRATAYRYRDEVIEVLAAQAPDLRQALDRARDEGFAHVILDGKIIPCDRCKEPARSVKGEVIDLWYSGKASGRRTPTAATSRRCSPRTRSPCGSRAWSRARCTTSPRPALTPCPRSTAPPPTAWPPWPIPVTRARASASTSRSASPPAARELDINNRTRNALQRSLRCLGERGFALLTGRWRALQHITLSPSKIGDIARAALTLTHFEHGYIT